MAIALPGIVMITAGIVFYLFAIDWRSRAPQHSGGGEGVPTVWQLIAHVEAEQRKREQTGRHRLREPAPPPSTSDGPPPLELQQRILEPLHRL
ncbi:hypothetical protein [Saccharopolyspora sp. NPDC002376]